MTEYIVLFRELNCSRWTLTAAMRAAGWVRINSVVYYRQTSDSRAELLTQLHDICAALQPDCSEKKAFTLVSVTEHIRAARREKLQPQVA